METNRILVAYATNSGTTTQVAESIAEELGKNGTTVDVRRVEEVKDLSPYSAVLVGGPMIMGWHRAAVNFIKHNQAALCRVPVAYFMTAKSLTQTGETSIDGIPLCIDPTLAKPPQVAGKMSLRERYATPGNYMQPIRKSKCKPVSVAFFGGKLELGRINVWQRLFVLFIIQAPPGGSHNIPFIKGWAADMRSPLQVK